MVGVETLRGIAIAKFPNIGGIVFSQGLKFDGFIQANGFGFCGELGIDGIAQSEIEFETGVGTSHADIVFESNICG